MRSAITGKEPDFSGLLPYDDNIYYFLRGKALAEFIDYLEEELNQPAEDYTHREYIIAHNFKVDAGLSEPKTPTEHGKEAGGRRKNLAYTLINMGEYRKKYKPPTAKELANVILMLENYPTARQAAINLLDSYQ
jgi:hypothetical protein